MTSARIQPFCRKRNINKGYFNGKEVWPRNITERKIALKNTKTISVYIGNLKELVLIKQ